MRIPEAYLQNCRDHGIIVRPCCLAAPDVQFELEQEEKGPTLELMGEDDVRKRPRAPTPMPNFFYSPYSPPLL